MSSCGLSLPTRQPAQHLPSKAPPPRRETQTPCPPPPTHATQKAPPFEAQVVPIGQQLILRPGTPPWTWLGDEGEATPAAKAAPRTPLFVGE